MRRAHLARPAGAAHAPMEGTQQMAYRILSALGLAALAAVSLPAAAAESYDNCVGFIDNVPATVSTQGVWCLRADVATKLTTVSAITVAGNNITIDCNGFKIGGLGAGMGTDSVGIATSGERQNIGVRHCNLRGFRTGIALAGGGHVVEDNVVDAMTWQGVQVSGDGSVVRHNRVLTTGGSTHANYRASAVGIATTHSVEVIDNTVDGVAPLGDLAGNGQATGIQTAYNNDGTLSGNRVRGVAGVGSGADQGIRNLSSGQVTMVENTLNGSGRMASTGIACANAKGVAARNVVTGFRNAIANCYGDGNVAAP
jgi:hypothetical protein